MEWNKYFEYKEGALFWKLNRPNHKVLGRRAGYKTADGYRRVKLLRKQFSEHRVIWEMFNGPIPKGYFLDHKNKVRDCNILENLRLATSADNSANMGLMNTNSSGFKGVSFNKSMNKFEARIIRNKTRFRLGYFSTAEEASAAYEAKAKELAGEFYYANH